MSGPRKRVLFDTRKAAELHLATTAVKVSRREYVAPASIPLFGVVAQEWLAEKAGRHPATLSCARTVLHHLEPLNPMRMDLITVATIEKLRDSLRSDTPERKALGVKTTRDIMSAATSIFKTAMRRGCVTANPAQLAHRPRPPVVEVADASEEHGALRADEVLSSDEIGKMLAHAEPGLWRTYLATAAAAGLRSEELGGLSWGDLELDGAQGARLFVRQSLSWAKDTGDTGIAKPRFFGPKTKSGYRTIPLPPELATMLKVWKLQCPPSDRGLVFCRDTGEPLRRSYILRTGLWPACRRAGLRRSNVKTMRHSFASGLLARGVAITVAGLMGHANASITLKVYAHFLPHTDDGAVAGFAASFLGALPARAKPAA
jgi:integrase